MANANTTQMQKQEAQAPQGAEFTRARRVFMPRTDIYETADGIVLLADMPGVDDKSVDITLENNLLTITGRVQNLDEELKGYRLAYEEYEEGDYQRVFTLSDEVDREGIDASVKNGVLRVHLPKSVKARMLKIAVKAE